MKKTLVTGLLLLSGAAMAQPTPPRPDAAAQQPVREPPSNEQVGVDVDRFVGDPNKAVTHMSHDVILVQPILTPGDPNAPGPAGAVLRYRREIDLGTMMPGEATPLSQVSDQQVYFVESGEGRIDDGKQYWDLRQGIALVIPPNQLHRLTATGTAPLKILMLSYDRANFPGMKALDGILVRDEHQILYTERNVHWSNMSKYIFNDIGERVYTVYMGPMSIAGPHAHVHDDEECWVKMSDGPAIMQLGSEIRPWAQNVGIEAPTTGQTVHAAINLSNQTQVWFYFAKPGLPRPPGTPAPAPNPNRPQINPAVGESAAKSTVPGKPLASLMPKNGH